MRTILFLFLLSFQLLHAQQKLPIYAIRTQYQIDAIRDTLGPKAGGVVNPDGQVYKDSVIFHYNTFGQLEREQVFRTSIWYSAGAIFITYVDDSSYYYRQHRYNGQGRKVSVRHYTINGNMFSLEYGMHYLMRIDSMAYDSHGAQLFTRRYEPYDFDRGNLAMVVKDGWEREYTYDNLGRVITEYRYLWEKNSKYNLSTGAYPYYKYVYKGTTNKLKCRYYYPLVSFDAIGVVIARDSLFTYDPESRITSYRTFPFIDKRNNIYSYNRVAMFDTTVYTDGNNSYEHNGIRYFTLTYGGADPQCSGIRNDKNGHKRFQYGGLITNALVKSDFNICSTNFVINWITGLRNFKHTTDGLISSLDSAYNSTSYLNGYEIVSSQAFDTVSYYGFKTLDEILSLEEIQNLVPSYDFTTYPNPTNNILQIKGVPLATGVTITNIDGTSFMTSEKFDGHLLLDLSSWPKGMYIVQIGNRVKKIVVE